MSTPPNKTKDSKGSKAKYCKPSIQTEKLTAVAAVCNGLIGGGRKAGTGSPNFCSSSKLKS